MRNLADRLWAKVDKNGPVHPVLGTACWVFTGSRDDCGYGKIGIGDNQNDRAHRVAWRLRHGAIPDGLKVCHHCDNPACCRDDHLFLGTQKQNMADSAAKGRHSRWNVGRTHCKRGHEFTPENTMRQRLGRKCRQCHNDQKKARYARNPAIRAAIYAARDARAARANATAQQSDQRIHA